MGEDESCNENMSRPTCNLTLVREVSSGMLRLKFRTLHQHSSAALLHMHALVLLPHTMDQLDSK